MRKDCIRFRTIVLIVGILCFLIVPLSSFGGGKGNGEGLIGKYSAQWWQWVFSIPASTNPLSETTGELCAVGQHGEVWFLGGSFVEGELPVPFVRTCTVPLGKLILMPVINCECSTAEGTSADDLKACAKGLMDDVVTAEASFGPVDGNKKDLKVKRANSKFPFALSFPPYALLGLSEPNPSLSFADGFWVLVKPPAPGEYELKVFGEYDWGRDGSVEFTQDITYIINVVEAE